MFQVELYMNGILNQCQSRFYFIKYKRLELVKVITEVWILQGICPLKDEWVFGCSLKTRLADQTKDSTTEVVLVK